MNHLLPYPNARLPIWLPTLRQNSVCHGARRGIPGETHREADGSSAVFPPNPRPRPPRLYCRQAPALLRARVAPLQASPHGASSSQKLGVK